MHTGIWFFYAIGWVIGSFAVMEIRYLVGQHKKNGHVSIFDTVYATLGFVAAAYVLVVSLNSHLLGEVNTYIASQLHH